MKGEWAYGSGYTTHYENMDTMTLDLLKSASADCDKLEAKLAEAKMVRAQAIRDAVYSGATPAEVMRITGLSRETIRNLAPTVRVRVSPDRANELQNNA